MSRESPRFVPAGSLVEITARTIGGRYLVAPGKELNAGIWTILGRALSMYPLELHAVAFMSNHWHALVSVADGEALARFVQYVHSNVARLVHRLRGTDGSVFAKAAYIMVGAASEEERLSYVLSQGVKEGLVRRCVDWPGVHSARALLLEQVCTGRWQDRRRAHTLRAGGGRGGGREPLRGEIEVVYPVDFAPLPTWRGLDTAERQQRLKAIVDDIERTARSTYPSVLGVAGVLAVDPSTKPAQRKRGSAPPIHTINEDERARFTDRQIAFISMFQLARSDLRGQGFARLPAGCFAPIPPFSEASTMLWLIRRQGVERGRRAPGSRNSREGGQLSRVLWRPSSSSTR
ncbi:MAG: transposase [Kofleriaceae bacterium]